MESSDGGDAATTTAPPPLPTAILFEDTSLDRLIQLAISGEISAAVLARAVGDIKVEQGGSEEAVAKQGLGEGLELVNVRDWPEEKGEELDGARCLLDESPEV